MATEKKTTSSTYTINDIIKKHCATFVNVPIALVKAIIKTESNWDIFAENPSDPSYGLMQIMPSVAYDAGIITDHENITELDKVKIKNPYNNIYAGTKLLSRLLSKYPINTAIQMYNVGERGFNSLGYRNQNYLNKVLDAYSEYSQG